MGLARGNQPQPSISASNAQASIIGLPPMERSTFYRPQTHTTTIDAGYLYPVYCRPALPGTVWKADVDLFVRVMTLLRPIFGNVFVDLFAFFQANRVSWPNWVKLQGSQNNPGDSTDYLIPHIYSGGAGTSWGAELGSIYDYLGLPVDAPFAQSGTNFTRFISALPFRMYNQIIDQWFRDQDYQDRPQILTGDGPDPYNAYQLVRRNKRQDMFTTARPWPQKGPAVVIPIGVTEAPVVGDGTAISFIRGFPSSGGIHLGQIENSSNLKYGDGASNAAVGSAFTPWESATGRVKLGLHSDPLYTGMVTDLTGAYATSVNVIREAFTLQQVKELDARGGTRFTEILWNRWRTAVRDDRLQRPEYIGGFSQRLDISAVPQTAPSEGSNPLGQLGGYGVGGRTGHPLSYSVPEHGYIMILVNIRADLTYSQYLEKHWTYRDRFDWPEPLTMHIGEQPILSSEMYYPGPEARINEIWGYREAWAEWRYDQNLVTNLMRPGVSGSMAVWNLALATDDVPDNMDGDWLYDNPPIDRVIAVPSQPAFVLDMTTKAHWHTPMPVYGTPGLLRM